MDNIRLAETIKEKFSLCHNIRGVKITIYWQKHVSYFISFPSQRGKSFVKENRLIKLPGRLKINYWWSLHCISSTSNWMRQSLNRQPEDAISEVFARSIRYQHYEWWLFEKLTHTHTKITVGAFQFSFASCMVIKHDLIVYFIGS